MMVIQNILWIGGEFTLNYGTSANALPIDTVRKANSVGWGSLNAPRSAQRWVPTEDVTGIVRAMAYSAGEVYMGGTFIFGFGVGKSKRVDGYVNAIAIVGRNIYVGGSFRHGRDATGRILRYNLDAQAWSPLYTGPNGTIFALASRDTSVWAAGIFSTSDGRTTYHIARWDGMKWDVINPTVDGPFYSMSIAGDDIYVSGEFQVVGNQSVVNVARYNIPTRTWYSLGDATGVGGGRISYGFAVAARGNDVYVGGEFTIADDGPANNIAHWDRTTGQWSQLGDGVNGAVRGIAIADNGDVYIGGDFTIAGGVAANHVARWDGTRWHPLGSGTNDIVWIVTLSGDELFVGGDFTRAGGDSSRNIARWNTKSEQWLSLGGGVTGGFAPLINAIVPAGGKVYAAGYFSHMGGVEAPAIAKWDGTKWVALGSGLNNVVRGMTANASGLYVAGDFTTAGGKLSHHFGRWMKPLNSIFAGVGISGSTQEGAVAGIRPNPVENTTTLHFTVPERTRVEVGVFDMLGHEVATLCDMELPAGEHELVWNTQGLESGSYLCRISCGGSVRVARAVVLQR
jgi:hypothetical protein